MPRVPILLFFAGVSAEALQWRALGPFGGPAAVVRADPHLEGRLFAATGNALLFRSRDTGDSWSPLSFPPQLRATLHALAIDASNPGVLLAGLSADSREYRGIFRSADAGETWRKIRLPDDQDARSLAIFPRDGSIIAAGTAEGVYLTRDGGASWELVSREEPEVRPVVSVAFDPTDPEVLFAGTPHLAWKTKDGGDTWMPLHDGMLNDSDIFSIYVDAADPARVLAGACSGIYRSEESGELWSRLTYSPAPSDRTYFVTGDPARSGAIFAGTMHGLLRSLDDGKTWRKLLSGGTRWIEIDPHKGNRVFAATDAGIFRSDDYGGRFLDANYGFANQPVARLIERKGDILAIVNASQSSASAFRLRADAPGWDSLGEAQETQIAEDAVGNPAPPGRFHDSVSGGPYGPLAATSAGLYRFDPAAREWTSIRGPFESRSVRAVAADPSNRSRIFAAAFGAIYASPDGGSTWIRVAAPDSPLSSAKQLLVDPGPPTRIFAVIERLGVYVSDFDRLQAIPMSNATRE